jgi:hypothetical protein
MTPVRLLLALTAVCHFVAAAAAAQPPSAETPEGVAALSTRLSTVSTELESIRREMGQPEFSQSEINRLTATPRTIFAQALVMFRKADRLSFELARQRAPVPPLPREQIEINHSSAIVEATLERINAVKSALGITEATTETTSVRTNSLAELLLTVAQASGQLNLLLERRFSSSDVFEQVTVAVSYAARLLQQFPTAEQIPAAPTFERFKRPSDVYLRLVNCFELLDEITKVSGSSTLGLQSHSGNAANVTSGVVYDLASLLVSELAHLDSRVASDKPSIGSYYPGRKMPSHTYQRDGLLEAQLTQLLALVTISPNWLTPSMPQ